MKITIILIILVVAFYAIYQEFKNLPSQEERDALRKQLAEEYRKAGHSTSDEYGALSKAQLEARINSLRNLTISPSAIMYGEYYSVEVERTLAELEEELSLRIAAGIE